jgi:mRNA interferase YafQ
MRTVLRTTRFKKDYKRERKMLPGLEDILRPVVEMLVNGDPLPAKLSDHPLGGEWKGCRDCHIKPDLVLIYSLTESELTLIRLGSHSELF